MRNTADVTGGKPIAVFLQSISDVFAINPLVAFYDIHGGKREVLFFYFVPDTTRDLLILLEFDLGCTFCVSFWSILIFNLLLGTSLCIYFNVHTYTHALSSKG
jgi:membrane-bound metal-dependent hydrolase YbcI (DUF457 family)